MWNVSENTWVNLIAHVSGEFTYSTQAIESNKQNRIVLEQSPSRLLKYIWKVGGPLSVLKEIAYAI